MSGFKLLLAVQGDLAATLASNEQAIARGATAGAQATGRQVQAWYREALVQAGLGNRLPRTIRMQTYPKNGTSIEPATLIWSNAPHILSGLTQATSIQGKGGNWLAIPTENAPSRLMRKRITPEIYEQRYGAGRLQFVSLVPGRSGMLVDNDLRQRGGKRGGFAPRTARSRAAAVALPIFWLVRQVRTRQVIDLTDLEARGRDLLNRNVAARVSEALADAATADGQGRSRATGPRSRRR